MTASTGASSHKAGDAFDGLRRDWIASSGTQRLCDPVKPSKGLGASVQAYPRADVG
jgi:hypothetical protein